MISESTVHIYIAYVRAHNKPVGSSQNKSCPIPGQHLSINPLMKLSRINNQDFESDFRSHRLLIAESGTNLWMHP
jgi:hypothetical protein